MVLVRQLDRRLVGGEADVDIQTLANPLGASSSSLAAKSMAAWLVKVPVWAKLTRRAWATKASMTCWLP
jgi:hypothetical protein